MQAKLITAAIIVSPFILYNVINAKRFDYVLIVAAILSLPILVWQIKYFRDAIERHNGSILAITIILSAIAQFIFKPILLFVTIPISAIILSPIVADWVYKTQTKIHATIISLCVSIALVNIVMFSWSSYLFRFVCDETTVAPSTHLLGFNLVALIIAVPFLSITLSIPRVNVYLLTTSIFAVGLIVRSL